MIGDRIETLAAISSRRPESVIETTEAEKRDGYQHLVLLSVDERDLLVKLALVGLSRDYGEIWAEDWARRNGWLEPSQRISDLRWRDRLPPEHTESATADDSREVEP